MLSMVERHMKSSALSCVEAATRNRQKNNKLSMKNVMYYTTISLVHKSIRTVCSVFFPHIHTIVARGKQQIDFREDKNSVAV